MMGVHLQPAHYQLTRLAIALGASNPMVRFIARRQCARFGVTLRFSADSIDIIREDRIIRISHKHWIYAPSIGTNFDAYFAQVEPTRENGHQVVDYSGPRLHKYRASGLE